ncbi:elongation factor Ts [bacterium BMS3Bbin06]|nr:elongation factor Ts [bacterium BMS3Abin08]GBE35402.1 elongation factor Ts [bacterium BMS3Bbin06]HDO36472.1 translation elongation factor Ts [Nitrospirota bacterium]HDY71962.1 translation elongation factor Ts [Nitrospirota bacterium]
MSVTAETVKKLRDQTGAGMMDCKKALSETEGDIDKAVDFLRKKGLAAVEKRAGRQASEGVIGSYIHMEKIGVLVEVNCETDFVARTDEFRQFAKDVAMHIAASNPRYLSRDSVPPEVMEREKEIYREQIKDKPEHVIDRIVEGKLKKFYSESCLLEQVFVKDPDQKTTIKDLLTAMVGKIGENIVIRRFVRFQLGETTEA